MNENKIDKLNIEDIIALTSMQQGMLFHYLKNPHSREYFEQLSIRLKGNIDVDIVKSAWKNVIQNNEMLRAIYRWDKLDAPVQIILKEHKVPIKIVDLSKVTEGKDILLNDIRKEDRDIGIEIENEPMRVILVCLSTNEYEMIISNHHIIYDGWSNAIIIKEFVECYEKIFRGLELKPIAKAKFKEYINWLKNQGKEVQNKYWQNYLNGYSKMSSLPVNMQIQASNDKIENYKVVINEEITETVKLFCMREKISIATILNVAWGILLQRYNNTEDVVFGTTVAGRTPQINNIENNVGLFINTIPLRITLEKNENVVTFIKRIEGEIRDRGEYESTSLVEIQNLCGLENGNELFDTLLVIENYPIDKATDGRYAISSVEIESVHVETNYNMTLTIVVEGEIVLNGYYNKYFHDEKTIERAFNHYINILEEMIVDSNKLVNEIQMVSDCEKEQLLFEFNSTYNEYPHKKTVHMLFEEQSEKTPDRVAISYGNSILTYRELNERANQLAWLLKGKGIKPDDIVAIMIERSTEMMIGILGVLKAGATYLPIDPSYPKNRIITMLDNSDCTILITKERIVISEYIGSRDIIMLDNEDNLLGKEAITNPMVKLTEENTVYQIYTSGSTGIPKGALIKHHSFTNLLNWYIKDFGIGDSDNMLLIASTSFDLAQKNLYATLLKGGQLHLFESDSYDYSKMVQIIEAKKITIINCTPSAFYPLLEVNEDDLYKKLRSLRYVFLGGEPINATRLSPWINSEYCSCQIVNTYGPTECTDVISSYKLDNKIIKELTSIPIGKPVHNAHLYVLDSKLRIVPVGVEGELYVGGVCVGKGYYKDEQLTRERFIKVGHLLDKLIYKTGDIVKWRTDGNLEFINRVDNQIKIRGFRIETGEIEAKLLMNKNISEAVVLVRESEQKGSYICAYIVSDYEIESTEIVGQLSRELPQYMIPALFVRIEKLPLTPSGKVDKKALPNPPQDIKKNEKYLAPRNQLERQLEEIWCKVLGVNQIGIYDNFFELGGHSLKAVQAINIIYKLLNIKISIQEFFIRQTIVSQAEYINSNRKTEYEEIQKIPYQDYYDLSYAQMRLWIINQKESANTAYNISGSIKFNGKVNVEAMQETFKQLIIRHESFRTYIRTIDGIPKQIIEQDIEFNVPIMDLSHLDYEDKKEELVKVYKLTSEFVFDLANPPLIIAKLVKLEDAQYELLICMHHIISDGWSMYILKKEFLNIYEKYNKSKTIVLEPLILQYKDFAVWQNKQIESSSQMKSAKEYWFEQLKQQIPSPIVSNRYQGGQIENRTGATYTAIIQNDIKKKLKVIMKEQNTTLFNVLLSALNIFLMDLTDQNDILIGTAGSGREHESLQGIMGYFINTVVLKNHVERHESFVEILRRINSNTLKALEYQSFPLEKIVEELNINYPQITVFFNLLSMEGTENTMIANKDTHEFVETKDMKFHMTLYIKEYIDGIEVICTYIKSLFKPSRIELIINRYLELVNQIAENPQGNIEDYLE